MSRTSEKTPKRRIVNRTIMTKHSPREWIELAQESYTDLPVSLFVGSWCDQGIDLTEARAFIRSGVTDPRAASALRSKIIASASKPNTASAARKPRR